MAAPRSPVLRPLIAVELLLGRARARVEAADIGDDIVDLAPRQMHVRHFRMRIDQEIGQRLGVGAALGDVGEGGRVGVGGLLGARSPHGRTRTSARRCACHGRRRRRRPARKTPREGRATERGGAEVSCEAPRRRVASADGPPGTSQKRHETMNPRRRESRVAPRGRDQTAQARAALRPPPSRRSPFRPGAASPGRRAHAARGRAAAASRPPPRRGRARSRGRGRSRHAR